MAPAGITEELTVKEIFRERLMYDRSGLVAMGPTVESSCSPAAAASPIRVAPPGPADDQARDDVGRGHATTGVNGTYSRRLAGRPADFLAAPARARRSWLLGGSQRQLPEGSRRERFAESRMSPPPHTRGVRLHDNGHRRKPTRTNRRSAG